jgi:uncharacterized protein YcfJ
MNHKTTRCGAIAAAISMCLSGCANIKNDTTRTKTEATIAGSALGALVGGLALGLASGGNRNAIARGVALGAVAGGAAGYAYGSKVARRKQEYASNEAYMSDCVAEARQAHRASEGYNARTRKTIAAQREELQQLIALKRNNQPDNQRFVALNRSVNSQIAQMNEMSRQQEALISDDRAVIKQQAPGPQRNALSSELGALEEEQAQLQASIRKLNGIKGQMGSAQ